MSAFDNYANALSTIEQRRGTAQADAVRNRGAIWSGTLANLAQIPGQVLQARQQERDLQQRQATQQQETQLRQADIDLRRQALEAKEDPALKTKRDLDLKLTQYEAAGRQLVGANESNWPARRQVIVSILGPESASAFPEAYPGDDVIAAHAAESSSVKDQLEAKQKAIDAEQKRLDDQNKPKADYTLNGQRFSGVTNQPIATGQPAELTPDQAADNARADAQLKIAEANLSLAQKRELRESQNTNEPLVAVMKDGKAVLVRRSQAEGMTPAAGTGSEKDLTQAQTLDAGYAKRIEDAEETLSKVEQSIAGMGLISYTAQSHMPSKAQSAEFQQYDQASRNLINSILRRESGAAISQSEFENAKRQYLPQPGDAPETLKLKAQNRKRQREALIQGAGKAYTPKPSPSADPMGIR